MHWQIGGGCLPKDEEQIVQLVGRRVHSEHWFAHLGQLVDYFIILKIYIYLIDLLCCLHNIQSDRYKREDLSYFLYRLYISLLFQRMLGI